MRHRRLAGRRDVETNRSCSGCVETSAVGHVDEGAVVQERGVQRGERARVRIGELAEVAADDVGLVGDRASASDPNCTPAGRPRSATAPATKRPLTKTSRERRVGVEERRRARRRAMLRRRRRARTRVDAIGATLVNRHSSSRAVGKPSSTKRDAACSRRSCSQRGAAARPLLERRPARVEACLLTCVMWPVLAYARTGSRRLRSSRSPSLRARAPVPCRRT